MTRAATTLAVGQARTRTPTLTSAPQRPRLLRWTQPADRSDDQATAATPRRRDRRQVMPTAPLSSRMTTTPTHPPLDRTWPQRQRRLWPSRHRYLFTADS